MSESDRIKYLPVALLIVGLMFLRLWPLTMFGLLVGHGTSEVVQSILR